MATTVIIAENAVIIEAFGAISHPTTSYTTPASTTTSWNSPSPTATTWNEIVSIIGEE